MTLEVQLRELIKQRNTYFDELLPRCNYSYDFVENNRKIKKLDKEIKRMENLIKAADAAVVNNGMTMEEKNMETRIDEMTGVTIDDLFELVEDANKQGEKGSFFAKDSQFVKVAEIVGRTDLKIRNMMYSKLRQPKETKNGVIREIAAVRFEDGRYMWLSGAGVDKVRYLINKGWEKHVTPSQLAEMVGLKLEVTKVHTRGHENDSTFMEVDGKNNWMYKWNLVAANK